MNTNNLARFAMAGVGAFFVIMYLAFPLIQPELNPIERFGSEYSIGTMGWLMKTAFFSLGAGVAALALGMARALDPAARSGTGIVLLLIAALGFFLSGVFDTDLQILNDNPPPRWVEGPSSPERVAHDLAGLVSLFSLMTGAGIVSRRLRKAGRLQGVYRWLRALSWLNPVAFVGFVVIFVPQGLAGLGQRIFIVVFLSWILIAARGLAEDAFAAPILTRERSD